VKFFQINNKEVEMEKIADLSLANNTTGINDDTIVVRVIVFYTKDLFTLKKFEEIRIILI